MPINIDHTGNLILTTDSLLTFSMNGAVRMPVGTTAQRPGSPLNGMIRYNSTDDTFEGYIDGSWGPIGGSSSGGANVTISDTPPVSPSVGDLWWDSDSADLFVYYDDGDSTQWVSTSNGAENVTQISANFLNNVDSDRIIGRVSAGNGDSEELTAAQVRTLLNVEDGATADQTGAEIVSLLDTELGSTVWQDHPTGAEIVSAIDTELGSTDWQLNTVDVVSNVDSDRILGRTTSGNGDSEELTATQVRSLLNVEDGATADQTGAEIVSLLDTELSSSGWQNEGDVTKVGTPVDNQIGVWTGDGTIEGDTNLTWDGSVLTITGDVSLGGATVETVFALTGTTPALDPANGTIQTHTLSGSTTYSDSFTDGESILLMIDDGTANTVTWPTMTWVNNGGSAPTLATSGYTVVTLWKVASTLYGALVGDGS